MKRIWSNLNLQDKFRFLALLGISIWLLNFFIVYFEINNINQATLRLERFEDLYNSILETRRYEKNFLLYKGRNNLDETIGYLQRAKDLYAKIAADRGAWRNDAILNHLSTALYNYSVLLEKQQVDGVTPTEETQENIRFAGKQMVDLSQALLVESRNSVAATARNAMRWPLTTTGVILFLFVVGAVLVNRKVVKPLVKLERATENVGRGDFDVIRHTDRIESEVDRLVVAFNRMVKELEARQEQIIHSRKIASLGTLVSGVAHELNNPINNIILTIDSLVGRRKISEERRSTLLKDILDQAVRASGIVKNLLDFSRSETAVVQDLDLLKLLLDTCKIAGNQITLNGIQLRWEIDPALSCKVRGNRQELQQVFLNLIINAVQSMPNGGELTIKAENDTHKHIVTTIQDTGTGISDAHLPHIFDPFFTTKEVGEGTGLGLSVSFGIINKHGGRITVDSRQGKGSTFKVLIPSAAESER